MRTRSPRRVAARVFAASVLLAAATPISAAEIAVRDTGDSVANGAALVVAVRTANANADADVIVLDPGAVYALDRVAESDKARGAHGLPVLRHRLTIRGGYAKDGRVTTIRRESSADFRLILVARSAYVRLESLALSRGATSIDGDLRLGGGLYNEGGTVHLHRVQVVDNYSNGTAGGIYNTSTAVRTGTYSYATYPGVLTLEESVVERNRAESSGGGIVNAGGHVRIDRSTIAENHGNDFVGGISSGNKDVDEWTFTGRLEIFNSTIARNQNGGARSREVGGVQVNSGTADLRYSTIADNENIGLRAAAGATVVARALILANAPARYGGDAPASDCSGTISSEGYNLVGATEGSQPCRIDSASWTDQIGATRAAPVDALLSPLANNGGFTRTMALRDGSPARLVGGSARTGCPPVDQRGLPRPSYPDPCDRGAYQAPAAPCGPASACNLDLVMSVCIQHPEFCRKYVVPELRKVLPSLQLPVQLPKVPECIADGPGCGY